MCTLPLLAGENIVGTRSSCRPSPASIDLVVHVGTRARRACARVREIVAVPGRVEGDVVEIADLFVHARRRSCVRADGFPPHAERFERAGFDLAALLGARRDA